MVQRDPRPDRAPVFAFNSSRFPRLAFWRRFFGDPPFASSNQDFGGDVATVSLAHFVAWAPQPEFNFRKPEV
jgi:hypothetical protein